MPEKPTTAGNPRSASAHFRRAALFVKFFIAENVRDARDALWIKGK
jgi:hypothetical protein